MTKVNNVLSTDFRTLFDRLLTTRASYEALRQNQGSLHERANHLEQLHTIRAELVTARQTTSL